MDMSQLCMDMSQLGMDMSQVGIDMSQPGMDMSQLGVDMSQLGMALSKLGYAIVLYFSQKQLPHKMKTRLVIIKCAGYTFRQLFLWRLYCVCNTRLLAK